MVFNYGQFNNGEPHTAIPWTGRQKHDIGKRFGLSSVETWEPGVNDERPVADCILAEHLWRISVFGAVELRLDYGTLGNLTLTGLEAPLVMNIPGQFCLYAQPLDQTDGRTDTVECRVSITPVTQGCCQSARQLIAYSSGPAIELDPATSFFTIKDSDINFRSIDVPVPAFTRVPLIAGCFLVSGAGFAEYEP